MNLNHARLPLAFCITLLFTLYVPVVFPSFRLIFFAPFIVMSYYRKSESTCLWLSLLCGIILDLLASHIRFGMHALNFLLTTAILYRMKQNFFEDSPAALAILTFFFSVLSTLIQLVQFYAIGKGMAITPEWVLSDLIAMPALDALYAFICFTVPSLLFGKPRRRGSDYFL